MFTSKLLKKKWIFFTILTLAFTMVLLKACSLRVLASDFDDTFYYGDVKNSYTKIETSGKTVYTYPQGTLIFLFNLWDKQYLGICCPRTNLVNNGSNLWGLYRHISVYDNSGALTSFNVYDFYQMEGFNSDNFYTINGVEYIIRTMEMVSVIEGLPYFFVWSNRTDGPQRILESYITGAKNYMEGVTIGDINASIDTSNLEQLLATNNQLNETRNTNLSTITQDVSDIKNSGSGSGITPDLMALLKRYDVWLLIITFAVTLTLIRQILHQMTRNIRGI